MVYNFNYEKVVVCGDIHGNFANLINTMEYYNLSNSLVIVAGDCGFGFKPRDCYESIYGLLKPNLDSLNSEIILVRGNHDDPSYFNSDNPFQYDRMKCIPDYSIISIGDKNILCVGGGISIDRLYRIANTGSTNNGCKLYWDDEQVVYDPQKIDDINIFISHVVTHSAPAGLYPYTKEGISYYVNNDPKLAADCDEERNNLLKIHERLIANGHIVRYWFYGHFHSSNSTRIGSTQFVGLDINEFKLY